jgi:4-diphosphocytidyl-2-C-methyl-D-erythritol kinase
MDRIAAALESAIVADADRTELAPAKINLALHVTGLRTDGYHAIETLVVFADYADAVGTAPCADGRTGLTLRGPFAAALAETPAANNLAVRAAAELTAAAGGKKLPPSKLVLTKRIPVAAGLGGGSADAAATLRLLNRVWDLRLGDDAIAAIGLRLGADVPMCLASRPVLATGIGEKVVPVAGMPTMPIVLAHPGGAVSTANVFARVGHGERSPLPELPTAGFRSLLDVIFWLRRARNDLEEAAVAVSKHAGAAAKALRADPECLFARMSGSGAAAFGIFTTMDAAERGAARLREAKPGWWVVAATTGDSRNGAEA